MHFIFEGDHESAGRLLDDLLIVAPDYFEVHRVAAFNAFRMGDFVAARNHYETAIEIEPRQPQLWYWYGGFLVRALGDYAKASEVYVRGLELDSSSSAIYREAARNMLFAGRFEEAQAYIDSALGLDGNTLKDDVILHDLRAQLFIREG